MFSGMGNSFLRACPCWGLVQERAQRVLSMLSSEHLLQQAGGNQGRTGLPQSQQLRRGHGYYWTGFCMVPTSQHVADEVLDGPAQGRDGVANV